MSLKGFITLTVPDKVEQLSATTIALHWLVALCMLSMPGVGYAMVRFELWSLYPWHKSAGVLVFVLALARVAWRLRQGWPRPVGEAEGAVARLERQLAKIVHWTLLVATLAMPLTGMIFSGASGHGFGTLGFELVDGQHDPANPGQVIAYSAAWAALGQSLHVWIAYVLAGAFVLHVAGAFKHHLLDRDGTLRRMLGGAASASARSRHASAKSDH